MNHQRPWLSLQNPLGKILLVVLGACFFAVAPPAAEPSPPDPFAGAIFRLKEARSGRVSSWDKSGDNRDFVSFKPGETKELLRLDGPGTITHVYLTPAAPPTVLRAAVLRMYWDDEAAPSVEVPLGDFF